MRSFYTSRNCFNNSHTLLATFYRFLCWHSYWSLLMQIYIPRKHWKTCSFLILLGAFKMGAFVRNGFITAIFSLLTGVYICGSTKGFSIYSIFLPYFNRWSSSKKKRGYHLFSSLPTLSSLIFPCFFCLLIHAISASFFVFHRKGLIFLNIIWRYVSSASE